MFAPVAFEDLTFPNQALKVWSGFEAQQWMRAGQQFNTTICQYDTTTTRISSDYGSGPAKWGHGSLAPNGNIYCMGHVRSDFAIINTYTDAVTTTGSIGSRSSQGSVYDKVTNNVYGFGDSGAKINTATNVASTITGPPNRSDNPIQGWDANILSTAGFFNYSGTRQYSISANTTATTAATPGNANYGEWGTLGIDGNMYQTNVPGGSNMLKFDPVANTTANIALGAGSFAGVLQHYNGKLYILPNGATRVAEYDFSTNAVTTTLTLPSARLFSGACIGADGKIWGCASSSGTLTWIDVYNNTSGTVTVGNGDVSYQGIQMGALGDLYLIPWSGTNGYFHKLKLVKGSGYVQKIIQEFNQGGRLSWAG